MPPSSLTRIECGWPRRFVLAVAVLFSLFTARAADNSVKTFDVPAGDAIVTLKRAAQQAGVEIMFPAETVRGVKTQAVKGEFPAAEALKRMIAGTELAVVQDEKTGALTVTRNSDPNAPRAALAKNSDRPSENSSTDAKNEQALMMGVYEVKSKKPFTDANVDLVRTMNDPLPYYTFKGEVIAESGATNLEDFLKQRLTMNTTQNSNSQLTALFANQQSSAVNLRGLGTNQTLVLINGRRTSSVLNGSYAQSDLNLIPLGAIDRIEVLPDSVAGIYGGSAVGGVINVVLKRDYTGGTIKTTYENTGKTDAPMRTIDVTLGQALENGRTHLTLAAHYSDGKPLLSQDRTELVADRVAVVLRNIPSLLYTATAPFIGATPNIGAAANLTLKSGTPLNSNITFIPAGTSPSTSAATLNASLLADAGRFNLAAPNTNQANGLRQEFGAVPRLRSVEAGLRRSMTPALEIFVEGSYRQNFVITSDNRIPAFSVPATAPTNPFQQTVTVQVPLPMTPHVDKSEITRGATVGFTLNLPREWKAEGDYGWSGFSYGRTAALPTLASTFSTALANGTVNPFVDTAAYPPDLSPYIGYGVETSRSTLNIAGLRFAGPVGRLPAGAPSVVVGLEHRREGNPDQTRYNVYPNAPSATNSSVTFQPGQSQSADSVYAEAQIPVVSSANAFPGIRQFDLDVAGRREESRFRTGSAVVGTPIAPAPAVVRAHSRLISTNPTVGLRYRPVQSVMLRASYGTGFVPPSLTQLLPSSTAPTTNTIVDSRRGNASYQTLAIGGGNSHLRPETSKSWTGGVVFEPAALPGFRAALDWYRIVKSDRIATLGLQAVVDNEAFLPGRVVRDSPAAGDPFGVGKITFVDASSLNVLKLQTAGCDLTLEWRKPTDRYGAFDFFLLGTRVQQFAQQNAFNAPYVELANLGNNGGPPRYKANATLNWEFRQWKLGWTVNYFGTYRQFGPPASTITSYFVAQGSDRVSGQIYHSLFASYDFSRARIAGTAGRFLKGLEMQAGVKNIFNRAPPYSAFPVSSTVFYYSGFGDPRMLSYWVSVKKAF